MKRVFTLVLAVMAAGCTSLETQTGSFPIQFSGLVITKAESVFDEGQKFQLVGGRCDGGSYSEANSSTVFDGVAVSRTASGWSYSPIKYWEPSSVYRFRAVYPYHEALVTDNLVDDITIADFEVNSVQAAQEDLLLSNLVERTTSSPISTQAAVKLTFSHLLSKINVKIALRDANDTDEFRLTKVTLFGMKNKGTYHNGTWDVSAGSNLECGRAFSNDNITAEGVWIWGTEGLLLIPETLGNIRLVLDYSITHDGATSAKSVSFTIPSDPQWQAGYEYSYTVSMSESYAITFSAPTVEPWGVDQAAGTIIIN